MLVGNIYMFWKIWEEEVWRHKIKTKNCRKDIQMNDNKDGDTKEQYVFLLFSKLIFSSFSLIQKRMIAW